MLETERLLIRRFTSGDLDGLIEMRIDPEVNKYLGGARLQNPAAITRRMRFYIDCYARYGYGMCAMLWKESGEMIGASGLQPLEDTGAIEVGYSLAKKFWRKGLGFEAARAWLPARTRLTRIVRYVKRFGVAVAVKFRVQLFRDFPKCRAV